jgi:methyl-accepting chemotaxis protein
VPVSITRQSRLQVKRSLMWTFLFWTWATIGPAVLGGLIVSAILAWVIFKPSAGQMLTMMGAGGLAMLLAAGPGQLFWNRAFGKRILEPLRELGDVMGVASEGDLTVHARIVHEDEIGVLADDCNHLIASLADIASSVRRSAESVSAAATQLSASSQEINSSTMEISTSVQQIAHGAELQSRKVEETTTAVEAIVATVSTVSARADEASNITQEASRFALHGEEATAQAITKIG